MTKFPVHEEMLITWKRSQIGKKFQLMSIGNQGRSFRIRHFYLCRAPPIGRNRDFTISGLLIWSNSPATVSPSILPFPTLPLSSVTPYPLPPTPPSPSSAFPSLPPFTLSPSSTPYLPSITFTHFLDFVAPNPLTLFTPSLSSSFPSLPPLPIPSSLYPLSSSSPSLPSPSSLYPSIPPHTLPPYPLHPLLLSPSYSISPLPSLPLHSLRLLFPLPSLALDVPLTAALYVSLSRILPPPLRMKPL